MLDPTTTAAVFPGQGSQFVGMGMEMSATYDIARQTFEEANALLGFALSELCFEGGEEALNQTENTQPALYVAGMAAWRVLQAQLGGDFRPAFVAGHSLGEFTALAAAGALTFTDGLKLVQRRGELMRDAGVASPGGMAALLGLDIEAVNQLCADVAAETGSVLVLANDNCPGQVVIAGEQKAIGQAVETAKARGAKRAVPLQVSIAAHSPLMKPAAEDFKQTLADTPFSQPLTTVISNVNAEPLTSVDAIRAELEAQLTSPVRWTESVQVMLKSGATTFVELGSKNVLTGLLRRIDRSATGLALDAPDDFENLKG